MQYDFKDFLPVGVFYVRGGQLEIQQYPKVTIPAKGMGQRAKGALLHRVSPRDPQVWNFSTDTWIMDHMEAVKLFMSRKVPLLNAQHSVSEAELIEHELRQYSDG